MRDLKQGIRLGWESQQVVSILILLYLFRVERDAMLVLIVWQPLINKIQPNCIYGGRKARPPALQLSRQSVWP